MKNGKEIVLEEKDRINFRNPIIPDGYSHVEGSWETGFVIQNETDKSEFVWIPVGFLEKDSTLDGEKYDQRFGRINFSDSNFSKTGYHEEPNEELIKSIEKYGGFYFARYLASKENEKLVFKKGNMPWVNIVYYDAEKEASMYANSSTNVVSLISSGAAFDAVLRWIIKSKAKTEDEVVKDSTSWGNYKTSLDSVKKVMPTGSNENWCAQNIYDIAGNVAEWTSEEFKDYGRAWRSGHSENYGEKCPAADRGGIGCYTRSFGVSFRAILYIK